MKSAAIVLALLFIVGTGVPCLASGPGQGMEMGQGRGSSDGPPPEAYTACEGKSAGDTVEIQTPRGDTMTGTCQDQDGRLALRPDNPPPDKQ